LSDDLLRLIDQIYDAALDTTGAEKLAQIVANAPRRGPSRRTMRLLPHIQRALQIHHQLGAAAEERHIGFDVIDRLGIGSIIVAANGKIRYANAAAERVLARGDGITVVQGCLRTADPRQNGPLAGLIAQAAETALGNIGSAGGVVKIARAGGGPIMLMISPLHTRTNAPAQILPSAIVTFTDPDRIVAIPPAVLAETYRLTPAEARLLAAFVGGQNLAGYARSAAISIGTARVHMKSVLAKTGFHSQVDLVRAVMVDPLIRSRGPAPPASD
jgi:DNA-binding CsgD family transcriptional regulator/sulfur carrier protein ThiS